MLKRSVRGNFQSFYMRFLQRHNNLLAGKQNYRAEFLDKNTAHVPYAPCNIGLLPGFQVPVDVVHIVLPSLKHAEHAVNIAISSILYFD